MMTPAFNPEDTDEDGLRDYLADTFSDLYDASHQEAAIQAMARRGDSPFKFTAFVALYESYRTTALAKAQQDAAKAKTQTPPGPAAPVTIATPFKLVAKTPGDALTKLTSCNTMSRSERNSLQAKDAMRVQSYIQAGLPALPDGKPHGFASTRMSEFLSREKTDELLKHTTDVVSVASALKRHFARYCTAEVFVIYDWSSATSTAVATPSNPRDLFSQWHLCTPQDVVDSTQTLLESTADETITQDLLWSYEGVQACILDDTLRREVEAACSVFPEHLAKTGPLALILTLNRLTKCSQKTLMALRQRVLYSYTLSSEPGVCVPTYNDRILKVTQFLHDRQVDVSETPLRILEQYKSAPCYEFRQHFMIMESTKNPCVSSISLLTAEANSKYDELQNNDRWIVTKKPGSAFYGGTEDDSFDAAPQPAPKPEPKANQGQAPPVPPGTLRTHDYRGNPIDRTPPKAGDPHTRQNTLTNREEHWCANERCKHWGAHLTDKHDEWFANVKQNRRRRQERRQQTAESVTTTTTTTTTDGDTNAPTASSGEPLAVTHGSLNLCRLSSFSGGLDF